MSARIPSEVMLEWSNCPLGCEADDEPVLTARDRLHDLPGEFAIVRCCTCGLMRTNPRPTAETIKFYYPNDYLPYLGTRVSSRDSRSPLRTTLKPLVRRIVDFKAATLPALSPGRMLEIGCASGAFLQDMAGLGWDVEGIEFSEVAGQSARAAGHRVHIGPLETAPSPSEPIDLVVGWMVIEHLHDPVGCLRKLRAWSRPGAWLAFSVPNAGSFDLRLFGEHLYSLHVPAHLYHFTPQTLEALLSSTGWKLEAIHHHRVLSNLVASTGYLLEDRGFTRIGRLAGRLHHSTLLPYLLYPFATLLASVGQTGRMTVWARNVG